MAEKPKDVPSEIHFDSKSRRDFLLYTTTAVGAVGVGLGIWPFIDSMNPAADTLAVSTTEIDISQVSAIGMSLTAIWQGKPVFIRHRTVAEITEAVEGDHANLPDPATDASRVQRQPWLIVVGICTHLGCIPLGQKPGDPHLVSLADGSVLAMDLNMTPRVVSEKGTSTVKPSGS